MKKILCMLLAMLLALAAVPALAEEAVEAFDWTDVIIAAIGLVAALLGCGAAWCWRRWVRPWLEQRELTEAAEIVVWAVEAIMGRYCGEEKWYAALERMKERGWNIDSQEVLDALKSAWKALDLKQIISGEKDELDAQMGEE